jgi:hypothetical protein
MQKKNIDTLINLNEHLRSEELYPLSGVCTTLKSNNYCILKIPI